MVKIVRQSEVMMIERLGSFNRSMKSGLHFKLPVIEQIRKINWRDEELERIDMRERVLDIPAQTTITKDNVSLEIDAVVYMQITDPEKAVYEINDLPLAISQLTQTTLRSLIGEFDLDETLASRDKINSSLKIVLDDVTNKCGFFLNRLELANVSPPQEVLEAMEKQMQAERERRAVVLSAEGDKESRIARSEGERQEMINQAAGEREALIQTAEGQKEAAISKKFKSLRKQNHKLWEDIQKEDVDIIQRMQLGRNSHAYNGGNFSPDMDNPTHQFHKWVATHIV